MSPAWSAPCIALLLAGSAPARAEDPKAAAEIDRQLAELAAPPPQLVVVFAGLKGTDLRRYKLLSASFELDGEPLKFDLQRPWTPMFQGEVAPGPHHIDAQLTYNEAQGEGIFTYADYKLNLRSNLTVQAVKGLRQHLVVRVDQHSGGEAKDRLKLGSEVTPEMLAQVDDSLPAPLPLTVPSPPAAAQPAAAVPGAEERKANLADRSAGPTEGGARAPRRHKPSAGPSEPAPTVAVAGADPPAEPGSAPPPPAALPPDLPPSLPPLVPAVVADTGPDAPTETSAVAAGRRWWWFLLPLALFALIYVALRRRV